MNKEALEVFARCIEQNVNDSAFVNNTVIQAQQNEIDALREEIDALRKEIQWLTR